MFTIYDAREITRKHKSFTLKTVPTPNERYNAVIGNYMLASYNDFAKHNAFEMRGCSWLYDREKDDYVSLNANLSMPKFFNVNECPLTDEEELAKHDLIGVYDKLDGSLAQPILFPDGQIFWKSKASFTSKHSQAMNKLAKESGLNDIIKSYLQDGWYLLFEFISPLFPIVLQYPEEKLVLIGARNQNGEFIDIDVFDVPHKAEQYNLSFDEVLKKQETDENIEGWILHFSHGVVAKAKTKWYLDRHRLTDMNVSHIAQLVLNETIDDALSVAPPHIKEFAKMVEEKVVKKFNQTMNEIDCSFLTCNNCDRKTYAMQYNKKPWFGVAMKIFDDRDNEELYKKALIEYMKRNTNKEQKAKEFLELV